MLRDNGISYRIFSQSAAVFILLLFLNQNTFSQDYRFRTFGVDEGLPEPYVYSLMQDSLGNLWTGTGKGVSKYNGFVFDSFNSPDSLSDSFVSCSIIHAGRLWFGHMNGGISFYDGEKFSGLKLPGENLSRITHFAESPGGRLWMSSFADGLFEVRSDDPATGVNIRMEGQLIHSFEFMTEDELLLGTGSGLMHCILSGNKIREMSLVKGIPEAKITAIRRMKNAPGFYAVSENDGLYMISLEPPEARRIELPIELTGIQDLIEDSRSDIWLASFGRGLIRLSKTPGGYTFTEYNKKNGFPSDNVKTLFEDREGSIWSGNYGDGLTQLNLKPFSCIEYDKELHGSSVFSIFVAGNIRWLGTEKGLLKTDLSTGKVLKIFGGEIYLPEDTVTAIYSQDNRSLWIGTDRHGLFLMDLATEKIRLFSSVTGILENSVTAITGHGGTIWAGTRKGLCAINEKTGESAWYTINQGGLPHNYIYALYPGSKGQVWVSTKSNILVNIVNGKVNKIPVRTGTAMATLGSVAEDKNARLWFCSKGSGVFIMDSDSIVNLTSREGLFSDYCYSILRDDNYMWVGHKGGLSRINTDDYTIRVIRHFDSENDNFIFNANASFSNQPGKVFFGSDMGLVCYDAEMENSSPVAPVLAISSVRIDNEEIPLPADGRISLSPGKHRVRIDFLGSSLKDPGMVTYQSILEGYELGWSEITRANYVVFPGLAEGEYKFILRASSGDGIITHTPLELSISIAKPIWKKWWFYVLILSSVSVLLFYYVRAREKKLLKEKRILEEKVAERTREIEENKNEIEKQRDQIKRKNADITSSIMYARQIQKAILPHNELINKLVPDNFILHKPKDIVSGDFYWITRKNDKVIFAVADCTGHGVPGAFMSMLGITLLNEIVNIKGITDSDRIVSMLRRRLIQSLQQNVNNITTRDGMDIALCAIDPGKKKLQFTGAMTDIVIMSNGSAEVLKADHLDVSISYLDCGDFKKTEIDYRQGDMLYLFSDGYQDQFGGEFDRKFLRPHFYTLLREVHNLPVASQKETLENKLTSWMKDRQQTDDITVIGIRL